ncbi:ADP-ribosylglycohydrolase family protein [Seohaeicola saemankumensis]|uniref:ADP-ribosylglycohydrolase family protein n=1 Tax=Seohaeicola TaxID=481178 RepID=UPI0035CFBFB3
MRFEITGRYSPRFRRMSLWGASFPCRVYPSEVDDLSDDDLLAELGVDEDGTGLSELRHVRSASERREAEDIANRQRCADFIEFKPLFAKVQEELDAGLRQTRPFELKAEIQKSSWFIVDGQKAYVAEMGEVFTNAQGRTDGPTGSSRMARHAVQPKQRTTAIDQLRWAQGALIGLLVGDALGSQVEFLDPATIWARHPGGLRDLLPGGTWNLLAGQPTDDGELALVLARALVAGGGFDRDRVAKGYIDWMASGPFDVGSTTAEGIHALAGRGKPKSVSQANGALMRVAPIGIAAAGYPAKAAAWARQDAVMTHPHPVCQAASAAFAAAIAAGVAGANSHAMWAEAYAYAGEDAGGAEIRQALLEAREGLPPNFTRNQGWVLIAFGNAFHRLWCAQDFDEALVETVMSGGDTDTNGAITGALLGAAYGRDAIPQAWRSQVLGCRAVQRAGVIHPRPVTYWADDAMELAEALITKQ